MVQAVAVVGAGVAGLLHAYALARAGCDVTLYERDTPEGARSCSYYAGGMLAPFCELESAEPLIAELGQVSMRLWAEWVPSLPGDVFFDQQGSLVVAHHRDRVELSRLQQRVTRSPWASKMKEVGAGEIQALEPALEGRFREGLFFPEEGHITPREVLPALQRALDSLGVSLHYGTEVLGLGPRVVETDVGHRSFDWVLDCRGWMAKESLPTLRGVKGESVLIRCPELSLQRPVRMMHPRYPLYIVPRRDHTFLVGATTIESEVRHQVTVKSALELLSAAFALHSSFGEAEILELGADVRPAFPDHLPHISGEPGLLHINGLYRHGYLLGPAIAVEVTRFLCEDLGPDLLAPVFAFEG